jgi:hypothetical protein
VTIAVAVAAGRLADASEGNVGRAGAGFGQAVEFFIDQALHGPQFFLDAPALFEEHRDLLVDPLQCSHAAMGTLEEGDGGGRVLGGGEIIGSHETPFRQTRPIHQPDLSYGEMRNQQ